MSHRFARDALATVLRYHEETKHHYSRYARSPGFLDWANQPDPFRRYAGSPLISLPRLRSDEAPHSPLYADAFRPERVASTAVGARSISRFFEYALAISAWKQAGEVRWALRSNPSSGNLHPTEGYLLIDAAPGLSPSPALYHYAPKEHALELRAALPTAFFASLVQGFPPGAFFVGFASVNWRETWKYGERAFRYCQHDVGHAIGSARIAAQTLGWRMLLLDSLSDDSVAALLGLNRVEDFAGAEREHPDCLAVVWPAAPRAAAIPGATIPVPLRLEADAAAAPAREAWRGQANRLSAADPVPWEWIGQVEVATWKPETEQQVVVFRCWAPEADGSTGSGMRDPDPYPYPARPSAGEVIRRRRSALAFDGKTSISMDTFFTMLGRVMPRSERNQGERPPPWDVLPWRPAIHLGLFVHRVDGLAPGLYLLARDPGMVDALRAAMPHEFAWTVPPGCPEQLPLLFLHPGDARQLAVQLSCGQDIAGDGAFSLGMIAEFESNLRDCGPWFYRRLFWEAGLIGQVLYLEAEAAGVRATGIGCYFDDPVHQLFGLVDARFQSLYHFTVGGPVEDPRLTTMPPYGPESLEPNG